MGRYLFSSGQGQQAGTYEKRFYVLDESSLASTKQMHNFVSRLHPNDRVLLVGDTRQHEAVEAGRPFAQLQEAGMRTVKLDEIVRQRDPELKNVVEQLARGQVGEAISGLERSVRAGSTSEGSCRADPIQFTAPANELKIANREHGTIQGVIDDGRMALAAGTAEWPGDSWSNTGVIGLRLNEALPTHDAKQFAWKQERGTMQIDQHVRTGRDLYIDGQSCVPLNLASLQPRTPRKDLAKGHESSIFTRTSARLLGE